MDFTSAPGFQPLGASRALLALTLSKAIEAFAESGLMDLLEQLQPVSCADLGRRAHVDLVALELILDALASGGVVTPADPASGLVPRWRLTGTAEGWRTLIRSADVASFLDRGAGATDLADPAGRVDVGENYRTAVGVIASIAEPVARSWAPELACPGLSVVEVGAGAAPWTRALLEVEPSVRATLIDLEPVIATHGPAVRDAFPDSCVSLVPADVFGVELDATHDLVVLCGFCRLFGPEANEVLFRQVASWLRPGGGVLIVDAVAGSDAPNHDLSIYALSLAARNRNRRVHRLEDFANWLVSAGFTPPTVHATPSGALTVLLARGEAPTATPAGTTATADQSTPDPDRKAELP